MPNLLRPVVTQNRRAIQGHSQVIDLHKIASHCQQALMEQCLPFWLTHACDGLGGGYFDFLTADGTPIAANKTVARQAEQVWAFAYLYTAIDAQPDWLDHALHGADFLAEHAHDIRMDCYTCLDRLGNPTFPPTGTDRPFGNDPLTTARVAAAYAQMHQATGDDQWARLAKQTFQRLLLNYQTAREARLTTPAHQPQPLHHLSQPVALLRALLDSRPLFDPAEWKEAAEPLIDEIMTGFLDKRTDRLREFVGPGGAFVNTPEGRRVSTSLTVQAASVMLDAGTLLNNRKLLVQATNWCLHLCEWAWPTLPTDRLKGPLETQQGLARWLDWKREPCPFDRATQRQADTHLLALAALTNGYRHTRHPEAIRWTKRLYDYTFHHFVDVPGQSWHLTSPPLPAGQAFKTTAETGCYGLIRGLADTWQHLDQCSHPEPLGARNLLV